MSLPDGGHLTHGAKVSFSGRLFRSVQYGVDRQSGEIDYDSVAELAREHRPKVIVAGFSAYSRVVDWQRFRETADEVGAYLLVDMAHVAGSGRSGCVPEPGAHRGHHHHHHPQDPAWASRRADSGAAQPRADQAHQFPGIPLHPGRAIDARDRCQGGGACRGLPARVQGVPGPGIGKRPTAWQARSWTGATRSSPAVPTIT